MVSEPESSAHRGGMMLRTALASVLLALLSYAASHWLTQGFQVWTAEGARRLEAALHPVPAPRVVMHSPGLAPQTLHALLADGRTVTLVDFVYTRCITLCAALGSVFQQMQAEILRSQPAGAAPLRLLSISFDQAHDSLAVLRHYAQGLRADPDVWRFARVADAAEQQRLLDLYQVVVIPDGLGGFEHNAALLVVDPAGRLLRVFDYAEMDTAMAFARWIATAASGARP